MLMTKFTYKVEIKEDGAHITVTRLSDGAEKHFYVAAHKEPTRLEYFMDSITDELAEGYWPKERKIKEKKNGS